MEEQTKKWSSFATVGLGLGAVALLVLVGSNIVPVGTLISGDAANSLASVPDAPPTPITTESGLFMYDNRVGSGAEAKTGMKVTVHYRGALGDGTEFDSSYERDPFTFTIGKGEVIKGWDEGIVGMKVGGMRTMIVPPELGYGAQGKGKIPPNSLLNFQIELIAAEGTDATPASGQVAE